MEQNLPIQSTVNQTLQNPINVSEIAPKKDKFSILDFLVIISALFVVAFLAYLFINPEKEGSDMRNVHRSADISSILTSIHSYSTEKKAIPDTVPISEQCVSTGHEICKIGPYDCTGLVNLSFLVESTNGSEKAISLPYDPENRSINGTGYYIVQDGLGSVTVCAPYAERNVEISFTKYMF